MSTTLNGAIEVYNEHAETWMFMMDTFNLFYQDYGIFATLFGVRNYIDINPVAANRGVPSDISKEAKSIITNSKYNSDYSFIMFEELKSINRDLTTNKKLSIQCDRKGNIIENGFIANEEYSYLKNEIVVENKDLIVFENTNIANLKRYFQNRNILATEILNSNWEFKLLYQVMEVISKKHKGQNIRWLVSFST